MVVASAAYVADLTSSRPSLRAKVMGFQQTVINSAYAFGPALGRFIPNINVSAEHKTGGLFCDSYGARMTFALVGAANLIACGGYHFLPETIPKEQPGKEKEKQSTYDIYKTVSFMLNFRLFDISQRTQHCSF